MRSRLYIQGNVSSTTIQIKDGDSRLLFKTPHQFDKRVVHLTIIQELGSHLIQIFISPLDWVGAGARREWLRSAHVLGFEGMKTSLDSCEALKTGWEIF